MNDRPLISVCINCYNAEATIRRTVESVLTQTYPHLQVIVVDDCSTDGTAAVLRLFDDPRLEIVTLPRNGHISNANNEALARVRGDFVAHLDADDVWFPDKLEKQLTFLQEHPAYGACFTLAEMVDENDTPVEDHRFRAENGTQAEIFYRLTASGNYLCHSSMFAKRALIDRVGQHDLSLLYFHDYDYWLRMVQQGGIYILPEKTLAYRLSTSGNSHMAEEKKQAHINELARVTYHTVVHCDDPLFREAFAARLRRPDLPHTPARTALEKAFLLLELFLYHPQNHALGLRRLAELFTDKAYVDVAREDFDFSIRDFYALAGATVYHDAVLHDGQAAHIKHLEDLYSSLHHQHTQAMADCHAQLTAVQQQLAAVQNENAVVHGELGKALAAHEHAAQQLRQMANSRSWKLTAPLRMLGIAKQIRRTSRHPRLRDGQKAACKIAMYGYFAHNFGDDLFFDVLLRRYPDTAFAVYDAADYEAFFARYNNAYVYPRTDPRVQKIDTIGAKLRRRETFEHLLLSHCDAVVHIGGSIYQQIGSWEEDLRLREKRIKRSRPFFSLSSNFGPYHTDGYYAHWRERFARSHDICLRDTYSRELFADVDAVRYAPDLLFALTLPAVETVKDRLFISVIDPAFCDANVTPEQASGYVQMLISVVTKWLSLGRSVCLSSFCEFQHDGETVRAIVDALPDALRGKPAVVSYDGLGNFDAVLTAIGESDYVLATRFHAMLLGFSAGKKVLPVCYNHKMTHVLDDLAFGGRVLELGSCASVDAETVIAALEAQQPHDVAEQRRLAATQFDKLDTLVRAHGGTVVNDHTLCV